MDVDGGLCDTVHSTTLNLPLPPPCNKYNSTQRADTSGDKKIDNHDPSPSISRTDRNKSTKQPPLPHPFPLSYILTIARL